MEDADVDSATRPETGKVMASLGESGDGNVVVLTLKRVVKMLCPFCKAVIRVISIALQRLFTFSSFLGY